MKRPSSKKWKPKKLTASQKKEIWKGTTDWTKKTGGDTFGYGGQVPRRSTDEDPRGGR